METIKTLQVVIDQIQSQIENSSADDLSTLKVAQSEASRLLSTLMYLNQ